MWAEDFRAEFPRSGGEKDECQNPGNERGGQAAGAGGGESGTRREPTRSWEARRISVLPLWWRITHSSRWIAQVLASELSLVAFVLLLAMVFSEKWLCLSQSRFYQRWPPNVSSRIYTSAHVMSLGLLRIYLSASCLLVTFIFFTLLLFPINLWIFELKKNVSIPIGWSYFIGWLVFVLYITCAALCHFNNKRFWSVITNCPRGSGFCSDSACSAQNFQSELVALPASVSQEEVPHLEPKKPPP
uniref:Outer dense fiber of sperm tails 4 n=1 Tax=Suricata suricatta TaxID=37032 RepID=A0A673V8D3_SURSU